MKIEKRSDRDRREGMKLFIDCEWNGFYGELISIALVAKNDMQFYEVLDCQNPTPWVQDNVIRKLNKLPVSMRHLQQSLESFLSQFDALHIVADWPEDIERFCQLLITGPGKRFNTPPLTLEIVRLDTVSANPHNALADAKALRDWYIGFAQ